MQAVVVVVVVDVVTAPQIKDPKRSGQVGLRLRLGPLEVTSVAVFPNPVLSEFAAYNGVLAEPSLPLRQKCKQFSACRCRKI